MRRPTLGLPNASLRDLLPYKYKIPWALTSILLLVFLSGHMLELAVTGAHVYLSVVLINKKQAGGFADSSPNPTGGKDCTSGRLLAANIVLNPSKDFHDLL